MNDFKTRPIHLSHFGFLAVTGRDAQKFLQGYTTCDLDALGDTQAVPGAICNIKGRMVCNFLVCRIDDGFLLRLHRDLIESTQAFLGKYIVFSKATLEDQSDARHCYGLTQVDADGPQELHEVTHNEAGQWLKVSDIPRYEFWSPQTLQDSESSDSATKDWQAAELRDGVVWIDADTTEAYIPQMINLQALGGISFTKGCYLGQEIVARMQYRGELKNRLFIGEAEQPLTAGTRVLNGEGKAAGAIVASAGQTFAAVLRADTEQFALEDGTALKATLAG